MNELPEGWTWKKLGEVCDIKNGKNQSNVVDPNGKYPIYGSAGIMGYANEYLCNEGCTIIGRKGNINSPIYVPTKFWNVDTAFGLSPLKIIDNRLLYFFCLGFNFKKLDTSTTIPSLTKNNLLQIDIPLPPLPVQHAIVAKIEEIFSELDKGVQQLETARQQLKVYRQSVLKWAFEGRLTNENVVDGELPEGWTWVKLGEIVDKIFDGPFGSNLKSSDYVQEGVRVIRLENIGLLEFKDEYQTFVSEEKYLTIQKHTVSSGDIIFSSFIMGETRVVVLPKYITKAINKADCFCIRTTSDKIDK